MTVSGRAEAREAFYAALLEDDPEKLYERAPCGYLTTTPDGMIVKVNQTLLTWTGHARESLVGRRRFVDLLTGGGRIYHETHFSPMLRMQDSVRELALDLTKADGARLPVLVNATLERDESGDPRLVRIAVFDATERRQYERELLRARRRAEESEARARSLAHTLQQTLMPPTPPDIPGLDVAAVYRAAGEGVEVGGDFYDVFQTSADDWVVILGDVCGKGVEAAVVTALVRHTVRAVAVGVADPSAVLHALNEVLLHDGSDRFCTATLLRLRRRSRGWVVTLASGGHPLPLLVERDGRVTACGAPGSLLGVLDDPVFEDRELLLEPGAAFVLFTDGVTEGRRGREQFGEARLREHVAANAGRPACIVRAVLGAALDFQGGRLHDDIAVVAVGCP